ncbi:MAG: glycosyltransferase family 2 protein, partial [Chloroflexota bacterium]|nr:glycosyltransferase family 2 protein [Chloroflexota bacterium]
MPRCSIVIPVHNQAALTQQCLDSLLAQPGEQVEFEIIVVDDASTDETHWVLAGYGGRVRIVSHPSNTGFARACNDGAALASGRDIVFLNNDTVPQPGWLDALARYADRHPAAGAIGSKLLFPDGTVQHAGVVFDQQSVPHAVYAGFPATHPAVNRSRRFQAVTAASVLVPRALFMAVGGFDPTYINGLEDIDFCLRLGERGHEVHYCH